MILPFKLFQDTVPDEVEKATRSKFMAEAPADTWISYTLFTGDIKGFVALMPTDEYAARHDHPDVVDALARFAFAPERKFVAVGPNRTLRLVAANDEEA